MNPQTFLRDHHIQNTLNLDSTEADAEADIEPTLERMLRESG